MKKPRNRPLFMTPESVNLTKMTTLFSLSVPCEKRIFTPSIFLFFHIIISKTV